MNLFQSVKNRGGGIISTGDGLGVFISTPKNDVKCPAGWVFVDITTMTEQIFLDAIKCSQNSRKDWPK